MRSLLRRKAGFSSHLNAAQKRPAAVPLTRAAAATVLALAALTIDVGLDRPLNIVFVLLGLTLADITAFLVLRSDLQRFATSGLDATAMCAASMLESTVWQPVMVVLAADVVWQMSRTNRDVLWISGFGYASLLVIGFVVGAQGWLLMFVLSAAAIGVYAVLSGQDHFNEQQMSEDLNRVLRSSAAIVYEVDMASEGYTSLAGPIQEITGWTEAEWTSIPHRTLIHPEDCASYWLEESELVDEAFADRKARFRRPDGSWVWLRDISRIVKTNDRWVLYGFSIDVTELESAYQTIRHQAEHDQLTGLSNRFVLNAALEDRMQDKRGDRASFALLLLDMDRFKEINDSFGHEIGDEVLCQLAERLRQSVRPDDLVSRLGGDEFAIVADLVAGGGQAEAVARRVTNSCEAPFTVQGVKIQVELSIGVALADDLDDPEELLRRADAAMYRAKRRGLDHLVYAGGFDGTGLNEIVLASSLPHALNQNEFEVWFQPKVALANEEVLGVEALVRWLHPDLGVLLPDMFMHLVKLSSVSTDFTREVLEQAVRFQRTAAASGHHLQVAVNVSVRELFDDDFSAWLRALLHRHRVDAQQLILEITEQEIMDDSGVAPDALARLADMGVSLSIDDFGTGYSSLARLRDLPVSEIKIDRRFVGSAPEDADDRVIISSIVDLARNLGLKVVAEGVERNVEAELLLEAGCNQAQGFLYGRPMAAEHLLSRLTGPELRLVTDIAADPHGEATA